MLINEQFKVECALAPASVATATETATSWINAKNCVHILFAVVAASLASGKKMQVDLYHADNSSGTNAAKLTDGEFTLTAAEAPGTYIAEVREMTGKKPYFCAKFTHDAGAAVICSAVAMTEPMYLPAENAHVALTD